MVSHSNTAIERAMRNLPRLGVGWCREGDFLESVSRSQSYQQHAVFCVI